VPDNLTVTVETTELVVSFPGPQGAAGAGVFTALSDTPGALSADGFLRANAGGTALEFIAAIPAADVSGLATVATTGAYSDLLGLPSLVTSVLDLGDTPGSLGTVGQVLAINADGTALEFVDPASGGASSFAGLTDTPVAVADGEYLVGSGSDLVFVSAIPAADVSGLATVATSGAYADLSGLPTLVTAFIGLSDTPVAVADGEYLVGSGTNLVFVSAIPAADVSGLAAVATSGAYVDLLDLPTLVTAFTGLSDTPGAVVDGEYLVGSGSDLVFVSAIPAADVSGLATVATTGAYSDLSGLPTLVTAFTGLSDTPGAVADGEYLVGSGSDLVFVAAIPAADVSGLATVATTGAYNDLSGLPTLVTAFTGLSDTPGSLGTAGQIVRVNAGANALEFAAAPSAPADTGFGFGDGSDGNVTVSSSQSLSRNMYYEDLTITGSGTLETNNWRVFVNGTLTINSGGRLHADGKDGADGVMTTGGSGGAASNRSVFDGGGSVGGGSGGAGGAGSDTAGSAGITGLTADGLGVISGGAGGTGGTGGDGNTASGGTGRTDSIGLEVVKREIVTSMLERDSTGIGFYLGGKGGGGGGGGGSGPNASGQEGGGGGGGGSGGGTLFVFARTLDHEGLMSANGGNGGNGVAGVGFFGGGSGGGGGAGGGGRVQVVYGSRTGAGTIEASGGTGGTSPPNAVGTPGVAGGDGVDGVVIEYDAGAGVPV